MCLRQEMPAPNVLTVSLLRRRPKAGKPRQSPAVPALVYFLERGFNRRQPGPGPKEGYAGQTASDDHRHL